MWTNHWTTVQLLSSLLVRKVTRKWCHCSWLTKESRSTKLRKTGAPPLDCLTKWTPANFSAHLGLWQGNRHQDQIHCWCCCLEQQDRCWDGSFSRNQNQTWGRIWERPYEKETKWPLIAALINFFDADPAATRQQLRELPELRDSFTTDLFALVIFLCDGLLRVSVESSASSSSSTTNKDNKAARFFQIAQALPMELQMLLCNRVFGTGKTIILTKHSETAFKKLGNLLAKAESQMKPSFFFQGDCDFFFFYHLDKKDIFFQRKQQKNK